MDSPDTELLRQIASNIKTISSITVYTQILVPILVGIFGLIGVIITAKNAAKSIIHQIRHKDKVEADRKSKEKARETYEESLKVFGDAQETLMRMLNSSHKEAVELNPIFLSQIEKLTKCHLYGSEETVTSLTLLIHLANGFVVKHMTHKFELSAMDDKMESLMDEHKKGLEEMKKLTEGIQNGTIAVDFGRSQIEEFRQKLPAILAEHNKINYERFKFGQLSFILWMEWAKMVDKPYKSIFNSMRRDLGISAINYSSIEEKTKKESVHSLEALDKYVGTINARVDGEHSQK